MADKKSFERTYELIDNSKQVYFHFFNADSILHYKNNQIIKGEFKNCLIKTIAFEPKRLSNRDTIVFENLSSNSEETNQ